MLTIPPYLRLLSRIEQVRQLRMEQILFHQADGCRESLTKLQQLAAEPIADLDESSLTALERMIVDGVLEHVVDHLSEEIDGGGQAAQAFLRPFGPRPGFDDLPAILQAVEGINISRARPIDALRRSLAERFDDQPGAAERLAVLAGRWLTGGMPRDLPAGSALVVGPHGSGRSRLVAGFAEALSAHGVGSSPTVDEVDLKAFTGSDTGLRRLTERIAELAGDPARRVLAFDNIEDAPPAVMDLLLGIVRTGAVAYGGKSASLDNRFLFFMLSRGVTGQEAQGVMPRAVSERLGNAFRGSVQEVIVLPRPSDEVLTRIVREQVIACVLDFQAHADQRIEVDSSMIRALVQRVLERGGFGHAVPEVVREHLRLPVSDLISAGKVTGRTARVVHEEGVGVLVQGRQREPLPVAQRRDAAESFDLEAELGKMVGLEPVKEMLRGLQRQLVADRKMREAGIEVHTSQSLHMLFLGNPGTGKTQVAKLVGRMLRELGVLREGGFVEASRETLVAGYVGQTADKTRRVVESALGGVLFVDEAYSLVNGDRDSFGLEAVAQLVSLMETHREDLVVIMAGYTKDMDQLLDSNPGLRSRFPQRFEFPDYSAAELARIVGLEAKRRGLRLAPDAVEGLPEHIDGKLVAGRNDQGNGRLARNLTEAAVRAKSLRVDPAVVQDREAWVTLTAADFGIGAPGAAPPTRDALAALDDIVGLAAIKEFVRDLAAEIQADARRRALGLPVDPSRSLHMVFKGNPGTGKTTVARIVGQLFKELKILKMGHVVEVDRAGLVAGYVGQTALKTQEKIREALGGLLFVDEAYALADIGEGQGSFGREALDTLVKGMEDHRGSMVVVLAGYSGDMERLLDVNPGLRSRFPNVIEFADYSPEELMRIADLLLAKRGLTATPGARERIARLCVSAAGDPAAGNGRYVRNLIEAAGRRQSRRLSAVADASREALQTLEEADLPAARHAP